MWNQSLENKLINIIPEERIFRDEPMYKHTTFKVGGPAKRFVTIARESELVALIDLCEEENVEYYLLGNGSNLLVSDAGIDGLCIEIGSSFKNISCQNGIISASSGTLLSVVAKAAYDRGLTGLEFAAGIPGSVGGAMVMNAGAYGGEMKDVVKSVRVYDKVSKKIIVLDNDEMCFGYRTSAAKQNGYVVLSADFSLKEGVAEDIKSLMDELAKKRREKQPLEYPSAGSTFKRPAGFYAGKLIEDSNLKGYSVGGAQVSEKHAGFIINKNNAKAIDIYRLIREVQEQVFADSGVRLETEVVMLGDFF